MDRRLVSCAMFAALLLCAPQVFAQGRRRRRRAGPEVGTRAPDIKARMLGKKRTVKLQALIKKTKKPVVLIFGSYT